MRKFFAGLLVLLTVATVSSPCFADRHMETRVVSGRGDTEYTNIYTGFGESLYAKTTCARGMICSIEYDRDTDVFYHRDVLDAGYILFVKEKTTAHMMPSGYYRAQGFIGCHTDGYLGKYDSGKFQWFCK